LRGLVAFRSRPLAGCGFGCSLLNGLLAHKRVVGNGQFGGLQPLDFIANAASFLDH
jgi:hypothetical protein